MSSEYGWTDGQIGELPLGRFRQVTAAIQTRKFAARREENSRTSWLARQITSYVAAGYMVEKGKPNPALDHAATLSMDDIETVLLGGTVNGDAAPKENKAGSYERFMMTLGGSRGRAG